MLLNRPIISMERPAVAIFDNIAIINLFYVEVSDKGSARDILQIFTLLYRDNIYPHAIGMISLEWVVLLSDANALLHILICYINQLPIRFTADMERIWPFVFL
ncbi:Uncharacterised protein [Serratia ficaria]|uniref:Uncharacterized protein n=1 Tax=Serratia ficaria TaxID=61651 RepID=A0A240AUF6_SERFI|nr:hypothetical protein C7332_4962 [Serratia ficaria]CAI0963572.1 Uncharacterised protein [Serratia ficaria]CAI0977419.1 Uncharacterised protein [Serratia ficaria]CAI1018978.1 Uncharacterised protein [Serratia ficaria]CAI2041858.1 Uncharacterised protein [Serratia ficaria]